MSEQKPFFKKSPGLMERGVNVLAGTRENINKMCSELTPVKGDIVLCSGMCPLP
jgi:hypothetical protein